MTYNHEHHLQYHSHKGVAGEHIGQLVEIPEVIVHAPTKESVKELLLETLNVYLKAFPTEHEKIATENPTLDEIIVRHWALIILLTQHVFSNVERLFMVAF